MSQLSNRHLLSGLTYHGYGVYVHCNVHPEDPWNGHDVELAVGTGVATGPTNTFIVLPPYHDFYK